ncbi:hypothetical protein D3C87_1821790 [compost metagenome]
MKVDQPVGDGELDDDGHGENAQRGKARAQTEHQEDRQEHFAQAGEERHGQRRRIREGLAQNVQAELFLEEIAGT